MAVWDLCRGRDPTQGSVPYSRAIKPGREDILMAACLNNIGQAISYIGKAGPFWGFEVIGWCFFDDL